MCEVSAPGSDDHNAVLPAWGGGGFVKKKEPIETTLPPDWFNQPSKLILEGMKLADGHVLEAQARGLHPKVIAESYQLI